MLYRSPLPSGSNEPTPANRHYRPYREYGLFEIASAAGLLHVWNGPTLSKLALKRKKAIDRASPMLIEMHTCFCYIQAVHRTFNHSTQTALIFTELSNSRVMFFQGKMRAAG